MKLHQLTKVNKRSGKRLGRGLGSGKGKTAARGTKGQKARENVPVGFIGGTLPLYKKLPFRRGKGNVKRSIKMIPLSLGKLSVFKANSEVDLQSVIDHKLVLEKDAKKHGVKIMGEGEVQVALKVKLPTTSSAASKISKAGGEVGRV